MPVDLDDKRERFAANPIAGALRRIGAARLRSSKRHFAKKPIVRRRQHANFPGTNAPRISGCDRIAGWRARAFGQIDSDSRSNETRIRFRHHDWHIEQMIEVCVGDEDRIHLWREMFQGFVDSRCVWLNARTEGDGRKVDARKIRIDQERTRAGFKLVTVRAEINHAHASAFCAWARIGNDKLRIMLESRANSFRSQNNKEKRAFHIRVYFLNGAAFKHKTVLDRQDRLPQLPKVKPLQLQEAKQQFSAVAEEAANGKPQMVTKHGKPFVVVVGVRDWNKACPKRRTVFEVLRSCPVDLGDLHFARSKEGPRRIRF